MADYIDMTQVVIDRVVLTPDPVTTGGTITVTATVREQLVRRLTPLPFAAGELSSGEV